MPLLLPPDADGTRGKAISLGVGNFFGAAVVRTRLQSGGSATKNPVVSEPTFDIGEEGGPKDVEFDEAMVWAISDCVAVAAVVVVVAAGAEGAVGSIGLGASLVGFSIAVPKHRWLLSLSDDSSSLLRCSEFKYPFNQHRFICSFGCLL